MKVADVKFKIIRTFRYYFVHESQTMQFGDFMVYDLRDTETEIRLKFKDEISQLLWKVKGEIVGGVVMSMIPAIPNTQDPLGQRNIVSWKCNVLLHTRKSWKIHLQQILTNNIRWRKPRRPL